MNIGNILDTSDYNVEFLLTLRKLKFPFPDDIQIRGKEIRWHFYTEETEVPLEIYVFIEGWRATVRFCYFVSYGYEEFNYSVDIQEIYQK